MNYKEKLEEAKRLYKSANDDQKYVIESLFPELKESEDEKVRKEIVTYLKSVIANKGYRDKIIESWIAWLEKQGEQKPAEFDDTNAKRMFIKALERVEEQNAKGYKLTDCDKNSWWEDFKAYTSCTIEQKPAEWSEEDEEIHRRCICAMRASACGFPEEVKFVEQVDNWLESLKDRVQPQPKQEWSEEDEKVLHAIRNALNYEKPRNYLKSRDFEFTDILDWLKSLRPQSQWKPSDEQMDALRYVTNFDYGGYKATLVSLYEQLKKLRGE